MIDNVEATQDRPEASQPFPLRTRRQGNGGEMGNEEEMGSGKGGSCLCHMNT